MLHLVKTSVEEVAYEGEPLKFPLLLTRLKDRGLIVAPTLYQDFVYHCNQCPDLIVFTGGIKLARPQKRPEGKQKTTINADAEMEKYSDVTFDVKDELRRFLLIGDNNTKGFDTEMVKKTIYCVAKARHKGCFGVEIGKCLGIKAHDFHHVITRLCDYGILLRYSTVVKNGTSQDDGLRSIIVGKQRTGQQTVLFHFRFCDEMKIGGFREEATDQRLAIIEGKVLDLIEAKETKCVLEDDLFAACSRCMFENGLPRRGLYAVYRRVTLEMVRKGVLESVKVSFDAESGSGKQDAFANALALTGVLQTTNPITNLDPFEYKKPCGTTIERPVLPQMQNLLTMAATKGLSTMDIEDVMGFSTKECYIWLDLLQKQFPMARALESVGKFHVNRYYDLEFAPNTGAQSSSAKHPLPNPPVSNAKRRKASAATKTAAAAKASDASVAAPSVPAVSTLALPQEPSSAPSASSASASALPWQAMVAGGDDGAAETARQPRDNATRESRVNQLIEYLDKNYVVTFPILKEILVPPVGTVKTLRVLTEMAIVRRPEIEMRRQKFGHYAIFLYLPAKMTCDDAEAFAMEDIKKRMLGPNKKATAPREENRIESTRGQVQRKEVELDVDTARLNAVERGSKKGCRGKFDLKVAVFYGYIHAVMVRAREWHRYILATFCEPVDTGTNYPDGVVVSVNDSGSTMDLLNFCRLVGCASKHEYVTNYLLAEEQPPVLVRDLPKSVLKTISSVLLRHGTHVDTSIRRLWTILVKLGLAELYQWPEDEHSTETPVGTVLASYPSEFNLHAESISRKSETKPLSYKVSRYGKIYKLVSKAGEDPGPPTWYDFADIRQLDEYWEQLKDMCLGWGSNGTGGKYTAWQLQKQDRKPIKLDGVHTEPPANLDLDIAFRRSSWKSFLQITCAQRRAMDQFLIKWKEKEDKRTEEGQPLILLCVTTVELVELSKKINISTKHILEFFERRNGVFSNDAIELTKLKIARYRCHLCGTMVAQQKSILDHYRQKHDQDLPPEEKTYVMPSYLASRSEYNLGFRPAKEMKGVHKRTRNRPRQENQIQSMAKCRRVPVEKDVVDWGTLHQIWFEMCGMKDNSLDRRLGFIPEKDDPSWDVLARLSGQPPAYCYAKMVPVLRHRLGNDPFLNQNVADQRRSLEEKACELAVRCLFLSPGHEYTAQRAFDIISCHKEKMVGFFHDNWRANGWIMLSKNREYMKPGSVQAKEMNTGQDRAKFTLTRRAKSRLFGKSCALYRWWQQIRQTLDIQSEGDVVWPDVTGELMFVMSENFDSGGGAQVDFAWDDNFDASEWQVQRRQELQDFIANFTENTVIMDEHAVDEEDIEKDNVHQMFTGTKGMKSLLRHIELTSDHPVIHGMKWSGIDGNTNFTPSEWLDRLISTVIETDIKPEKEGGPSTVRQASVIKPIVNPFISYDPPVHESHGVAAISIPNKTLAEVLRTIPKDGVLEITLDAACLQALETLRLVCAVPQGAEYRIYPVTDALMGFAVSMPKKRVSSAASHMAVNSRLDKQYGPPPTNWAEINEKATQVLKLSKMTQYKVMPRDVCLLSSFSKLDGSLNVELINMLMLQICTHLQAAPGASSCQLAETFNLFDQCELDMFVKLYMTKWVTCDEDDNYFGIPLREIDIRFF
eukprot:GEMP01000755.1.p1 GENE.GEMP01000755.1~~GEMP01000755.1.p1  ORF type:complete len:1642 (+),score=357.34 GEMP01000755.1:200-5125(+)